MGSSYLPSELNAAYLLAELEEADMINEDRLASWDAYYEMLSPLAEAGRVELPVVPEECAHNAHMFYVKTANIEERTALTAFLKENGIGSAFHYVPLHSAPAGSRFGRFHGEDRYTTNTFERLLRLPMFYGLGRDNVEYICDKIKEFYR
jgi:dTDP-4-amino-4,6-dideoxygalactose transaminase